VSAIRVTLPGVHPAHRGATVLIALVVVSLAATLLFIGASSPYTHANLNSAFDEGYTRTEQIVVGPAVPFAAPRATGNGADPVARGQALFVTEGCVGCHALGGQGGAVAKAIAAVDQTLLLQKVREGTPGMPPFSTAGLTDQQVADIGAYLRSLPPVK
jgi:mono/diheme cytochrome c family protein